MDDDAEARRAHRLKRLDELSKIGGLHPTTGATPTAAQASKEPVAVEPLRGALSATTWKLWIGARKVELWQAAALVQGVDPDSLSRSRDSWMAGPGRGPFFEARSFPSEEKCVAFDEAFLFAKRAATYGGPISLPLGFPRTHTGSAAVSLREVVAYFVGCDWPDIPAPLLAMVPAVTKPTAQAEPSTVPAPVPGLVSPGPTPLVHKPKRRADCLKAVIQMASERAADPTDWPSAWAALVALALQADRPAPLLGYTEGEGVKYQTDNADAAVAWLSRQAFRKRAGRKT